ncbi:hypothetical protein GCM10009104_03750 [Marinobacterium maritimum]|uniref:Uncharacterized protein n=1 Tax=Marinobacterium maritimum TaxID=500162 RepID=A0ABN1I218_9GAMM
MVAVIGGVFQGAAGKTGNHLADAVQFLEGLFHTPKATAGKGGLVGTADACGKGGECGNAYQSERFHNERFSRLRGLVVCFS